MAADSILIGIPEISEIAKVSRSAVGNWRKRHPDFPEPGVQSDSGVLFDLRSIEEWLLAHGKIDEPIPPGALLWRFADAIRGNWPAETLFDFTSSWLCYLEACDRTNNRQSAVEVQRGLRVEILEEHRWAAVREAPDHELERRLRSAAKAIEVANPQLEDLLGFLAPKPFPEPTLVRAFVAELEASVDDATPRFDLFEEAQQRVVDLSRESAEWTTPDDLSYLLTELIGKIEPGSTVLDPACGTGGLLLMAGVADSAPDVGGRFVGADADRTAARYARARFFLYGVDAEIDVLDSLRRDLSEWPRADVVLCDPPLNMKNWGDAELYRSDRWRYGSPPPTSADLAWVQLSLLILTREGRAALVLPPRSCFAGGREATIREALLRAGALEAVIETPARLRRDVSIPLTIWLLRSPESVVGAVPPVLLVDASNIGTPGRSTLDLGADEVQELVALVHDWRTERILRPRGDINAVAADVADIVAAEAILTVRNYLPVEGPAEIQEVAAERRESLAELRQAFDSLERALRALDEPPKPTRGSQNGSQRLGDVAEVFRPRAGKEADDGMSAQAGDLLLTTTPDGFATRLMEQGEAVSGLHAVIIRITDPGKVCPAWLLLWTRTQAFASLARQHARGTAFRSLSVGDLAEFDLLVPTLEIQAQSADLLDRLDALASTASAVSAAVERFRSAELGLFHAGVAETYIQGARASKPGTLSPRPARRQLSLGRAVPRNRTKDGE